MDNKLLIVMAGLVIIAITSAPVLAAAPGANPLDQILTIVKDIQKKMQTPPEPIRYEYYTPSIFPEFDAADKSFLGKEQVTNGGSAEAEVCWTKYLKDGANPWELHSTSCITLQPGEQKSCTPVIVMAPDYQYRVKITTNSKYVIPHGIYMTTDASVIIAQYLPGDFQKVEIYS